jgi:hypothetical protein
MKKVVEKSTVAHLWANQTQDEARTPTGNFYFWRETIYSYGSHFPIAKHIVHEGKKAILFTLRTYSTTTAQQISIVRQAVRYSDNVIYCLSPNSSHEDNFHYWLSVAKEITGKLVTARKPEKYLSELAQVKQQANTYAQFFGIEIPVNLQAVLDVSNKSEYLAYAQKEAEYIQQEQAKKEAVELKKYKQDVIKFRSGEIQRIHNRGNNFDVLRINRDTNQIETSQGVVMDVPIAYEFFKMLQEIIASKSFGNYEAQNINVGQFRLIEITKEYTVIGCHKLAHKELNKTAKDLGLL